MATNNAVNNLGKLLQSKVVQYNPTAAQALTTSYADVDGSSYTFTPVAAAAASNIVYQYLNIQTYSPTGTAAVSHWKLMVNGALETEMNFTHRAQETVMSIAGTIASWGASAQVIKLQAREYDGATDVALFETESLDGGASAVLVRPTLLIMEFAT